MLKTPVIDVFFPIYCDSVDRKYLILRKFREAPQPPYTYVPVQTDLVAGYDHVLRI